MLTTGFTNKEIQTAIDNGNVAADWMSPELLASAISRIAAMDGYFQNHDPGPFDQALRIYRLLGQIARRNFIQQYGYPPEQSPIPRVKITGEESQREKLKPANYQPPMFHQEEEE